MPSPCRVLTEDTVRAYVEEHCFRPGSGLVGVESEWFVTDGPTLADLRRQVCDPLPGGSTITFEPGGQIELSSAVGTLDAVWQAVEADRAELRRRLATLGAGVLAAGMHPSARPMRVLDDPRYAAMETYWGSGGEHDPGAGLAMMCTTASIQVNIDATGTVADRDRRWKLAHALSPVLGACFANSPMARGAPTGWRSTRLGIWEGLDRTRAGPALRTGRAFDDWTGYLLDANVMMIGRVPLVTALPFAKWMAKGHELGWPDADDLAYHLTTLFPPVRAKAWLEMRVIDAVGDPWWPVPMAVVSALMDDEAAFEGAVAATGRASWCWCEAPRWALSYEPLADAAQVCFTLARDALARQGAPPPLIGLVEAYQERFVDRGLCPADLELAEVEA